MYFHFHTYLKQTDCRTHFADGRLTPSNRYSINSWAYKHIEEGCSPNTGFDTNTCTTFRYEYNNAQMFQKFVSAQRILIYEEREGEEHDDGDV